MRGGGEREEWRGNETSEKKNPKRNDNKQSRLAPPGTSVLALFFTRRSERKLARFFRKMYINNDAVYTTYVYDDNGFILFASEVPRGWRGRAEVFVGENSINSASRSDQFDKNSPTRNALKSDAYFGKTVLQMIFVDK